MISKVANFIHVIQNFFFQKQKLCINLEISILKATNFDSFINIRKISKDDNQKDLQKTSFRRILLFWEDQGSDGVIWRSLFLSESSDGWRRGVPGDHGDVQVLKVLGDSIEGYWVDESPGLECL